MTLRLLLKRAFQSLALVFALPLALLCGFGRVTLVFDMFAHCLAFAPGALGSYCRVAFYRWVVTECSLDVVIGFGTFFSRRQMIVHPYVSIGSYCILARAEIGTRTQISSLVQVTPPGVHTRDAQGRLSGSVDTDDDLVRIGSDCWIGANTVVMANVGDQSTVGAGSVVVKPVPARVVAVGAPARPIKSTVESALRVAAE